VISKNQSREEDVKKKRKWETAQKFKRNEYFFSEFVNTTKQKELLNVFLWLV